MDSSIYNITIDSVPNTGGTWKNGTWQSNHICGSWCTHTLDPIVYNYWTGTYPTTIYMYQIKCPVCDKMNWAQLETTVECKTPKCKAKLRAVTSKPEHIVEVEV